MILFYFVRFQELLITAGGENVAPVIIEQTVQSELLHVGYAVLIGDQRKFLSILLTLKVNNTFNILIWIKSTYIRYLRLQTRSVMTAHTCNKQ